MAHTLCLRGYIFIYVIMKKEIWKDIIGEEGKYQISNLFRIKRLKRKTKFGKQTIFLNERICVPYISKVGYYQVSLGRYKKQYLHRLIANGFIPNTEHKPCINHKNGIKTDNSIENLEWCTYRENSHHAFKNGLNKGIPRYGNDNSSCKISFENVLKIRDEKGIFSLKETSKKYSISISHVWQIQNNKNRINK